MKSSPAPLRRIAALSVAITIFTATIASAQSTEAAPPASPKTPLLSRAAFARLIQSLSVEVAPAPVVAKSPRPSLLRQGTAMFARQSQATPTPAPAPKQKSWAARNKAVVAILFGLAGFLMFTAWKESQE